MEEYALVVREHERSTEQVYSVVRATICDPFLTVAATRQSLRVFSKETDHKVSKPSGVAFLSVASSDTYDTGDMYDGDWVDGD